MRPLVDIIEGFFDNTGIEEEGIDLDTFIRDFETILSKNNIEIHNCSPDDLWHWSYGQKMLNELHCFKYPNKDKYYVRSNYNETPEKVWSYFFILPLEKDNKEFYTYGTHYEMLIYVWYSEKDRRVKYNIHYFRLLKRLTGRNRSSYDLATIGSGITEKKCNIKYYDLAIRQLSDIISNFKKSEEPLRKRHEKLWSTMKSEGKSDYQKAVTLILGQYVKKLF